MANSIAKDCLKLYNCVMKTLCPNCKEQLSRVDNRAVCKNGHSFDFAKEGYLYLLKPNDKNSHDPGDNKEMVVARRDFLSEGCYAPLANKIADIINARFSAPIALIDAGVGTGFYLNTIISKRDNLDDAYLGVDISKHAVKIASKTNKRAECSVASVYDMPFESESADVITCIFSPYALNEYARCLKDDGILIIANPASNHLIELRNALYDDVREVDSPLIADGWDVKCEDISYSFNVKNISNLLTMTPYVYRAPKERVDQVRNMGEMTLTVHFHVYVLTKSTR